MEKQD